MESTAAELHVERAGGVATIWFDRPEARNAFTRPMFAALEDLVRRAQEDRTVHVVVFAGRGPAYSSGVDLAYFQEDRDAPELKTAIEQHIQRVALAVERLDKPLISAVNGPAVGAGLDLALMADLRLAAPAARFNTGYIRMGIAPGGGCAYYLPRLVGPGRAMELMFTGEFVDADEAERMGLVNRVVRDRDLAEEVADLAARIASRDPLALRLTKRAVRAAAHADLATVLDLSSSHAAVTGAVGGVAPGGSA